MRRHKILTAQRHLEKAIIQTEELAVEGINTGNTNQTIAAIKQFLQISQTVEQGRDKGVKIMTDALSTKQKLTWREKRSLRKLLPPLEQEQSQNPSQNLDHLITMIKQKL